MAAGKSAGKTKTAGAIRAGNGKYHFRMDQLKKVPAGTGYSTSHGGVVEGARILVGYIHKPRGTGSRMHSHKNEQLNYVLRGTLMGSVNGKKVVAPAGTLIYIPANAPHNLIASPKDKDVIFLAIKDLSQGIIGMAVDGKMTGPHYEKGFGPAGKKSAGKKSAAKKPAKKNAGAKKAAKKPAKKKAAKK